jgi:crotonobetainyl-CoA:carnitine CoA-transferase CaiB-like acyl-CoA transferase
VRDVGEAVSMPHLVQRDMCLPLQMSGMPDGRDRVAIVNAGFRMESEGPHVSDAPPLLDEHRQEILAWLQTPVPV